MGAGEAWGGPCTAWPGPSSLHALHSFRVNLTLYYFTEEFFFMTSLFFPLGSVNTDGEIAGNCWRRLGACFFFFLVQLCLKSFDTYSGLFMKWERKFYQLKNIRRFCFSTTLSKVTDIWNYVWLVKSVSWRSVRMFCFDSNKYNLIIQFIAVLMGIFLPVRLKYLSYLRVILLKALFSGDTKVIKTFLS